MASIVPSEVPADFVDYDINDDIAALELMIRGRLERDKGNLAGALALFNDALEVLRGNTSAPAVTLTQR